MNGMFNLAAQFQFPSNGKLHSNNMKRNWLEVTRNVFQFPSNGKLHSNWIYMLVAIAAISSSFNSLQTGNCIQTTPEAYYRGSSGQFQFPSNGKLHSNTVTVAVTQITPSFNSLQTGNCIQTFIQDKYKDFPAEFQFPSNGKLHSNSSRLQSCYFYVVFQFPSNGKLHSNAGINNLTGFIQDKFQFPSNGKLHSNLKSGMTPFHPACEFQFPSKRETAFKPFIALATKIAQEGVSIPFKRETAFKPGTAGIVQSNRVISFNSLQTGNCIQTILKLPCSNQVLSFNSLQTGNCIQTNPHLLLVRSWRCVSIPFKRETAFKQFLSDRGDHTGPQVSIPFKRETAFKLCFRRSYGMRQADVSIPFKRETAFKRNYDYWRPWWGCQFQFPSNGKLHSNQLEIDQSAVEAKFQFPSNGKLHSNLYTLVLYTLVINVSIPFKRETAFKRPRQKTRVSPLTRVSIPFKRETAFKQDPAYLRGLERGCVSIPFKRETAFKLLLGGKMNYLKEVSFNSLQTGNCIQTMQKMIYSDKIGSFQFPSNGKLHSNL